jgi:peptide/nickel transport system permease protein
VIHNNNHLLGFDRPIQVQYWDFLKGMVVERNFPDDKQLEKTHPELITRCDAPCLGYSPLRNSLIWTFLKPRIPITIFISLAAFVMWIVAGVILGILAALRKGKFLDRLVVGGSLFFYSFPTFFIGLLFLNLFVFQFKWLPIPEYVSPSDNFGSFLGNLFLPALTLAVVYAAAYVRITRTYMLETMSEDYLRTARAKGLGQGRIIFKHTLRAALTPIVTLAGLDLGALLAGAPITEFIFGFQGVGNASVQAAISFDLPMTVAIVLLSATFVIVANLVVDLLYGVIDPRVRY